MPGRTPAAAREAFLAPLRRSIDCITTAQLYTLHAPPGEVERLALSEHPLRLRSAVLGGIQLMLTHSFRAVSDGQHDWHVSQQVLAASGSRETGAGGQVLVVTGRRVRRVGVLPVRRPAP